MLCDNGFFILLMSQENQWVSKKNGIFLKFEKNRYYTIPDFD